MAASSSLPLAILIFLLVLVASAVPATAGGEYNSGARMVIIRSPATTRFGVGAAGAQSNRWRQHYGRRLVEDEVTPELGGLLGASEGSIGYSALNKDAPACQKGNQGCAAKDPGQPYTRGCTYPSQCAHTPSGVAN